MITERAIIDGTSEASSSLVLAFQTDRSVDEVCAAPAGIACRVAYRVTGSESLAGLADQLVDNALRILLILFVAFLFRWLVRRHAPRLIGTVLDRQDAAAHALAQRADPALTESQKIERALRRERARQRANTLGNVIASIASVLILFVAVLMILDQLGINLAPLIAGAGVVGIALGFGAQQMVRDFLAGLFIIMEDEYGVGDVVDTGLATGVVERLTLRITQLRDVDGTVWYVPNGEIQRAGNLSQLWSRAVIDIDVAYDTDIDVAERVLLQVATEMWQDPPDDKTIIAEPEFWGVEAFGADGVTLRLVVRTEPIEQWAVARELRGRIKRAFDEAGIEIPFPQRTVWMKADGMPADPDPSVDPTHDA